MRLILRYVLPASFVIMSATSTCVAQGIITTIAGNGITQYIGDGYPATDYSLAAPTGICTDAHGNIYEADYAVARIRRLAGQDTLFTYGGTGTGGYSGDGGQATAAMIRQPNGIAIDAAGNVFFTEEYNNIVRKINAAGIISTVCGNGGGGYAGDGGPATAAHMEQPAGLCLDKWGNLYIADKGNNRVRRVDAATGVITTYAGAGVTGYSGDNGSATDATLTSPAGVCADTTGNIYIADYNNNAIRKVDITTGIITTVAGNGFADFSGDDGPATNAAIVQPNSVFMSKRGNLYISDYGNNRIRVVTADGIMHTLAGSGLYGFSGDGGPALEATFIGPTGVCADDSEYVYIADGGNSAIRKITPVYNSVREVSRGGMVSVLPNPTSGNFTIVLPLPIYGIAMVSVCNSIGSVVYTTTCSQKNININLSAYPPGMYYIRVQTPAGLLSGKVTVMR